MIRHTACLTNSWEKKGPTGWTSGRSAEVTRRSTFRFSRSGSSIDRRGYRIVPPSREHSPVTGREGIDHLDEESLQLGDKGRHAPRDASRERVTGFFKTQIALWALGDRSSQHIFHRRGLRLSLLALFPGTADSKLSGHHQGSLDSLPERSRNALDLSTKASIPA